MRFGHWICSKANNLGRVGPAVNGRAGCQRPRPHPWQQNRQTRRMFRRATPRLLPNVHDGQKRAQNRRTQHAPTRVIYVFGIKKARVRRGVSLARQLHQLTHYNNKKQFCLPTTLRNNDHNGRTTIAEININGFINNIGWFCRVWAWKSIEKKFYRKFLCPPRSEPWLKL